MSSNNDLVVAIRLLTEKMIQERIERPDSAGDMFKRLAKVKSPYFKGETDLTF